jgi:hypothetical protein
MLHASLPGIGSIEVYDHRNRKWIPYVPDYKKWEQHIADVSDGRVRTDHKRSWVAVCVGVPTRRKSNW